MKAQRTGTGTGTGTGTEARSNLSSSISSLAGHTVSQCAGVKSVLDTAGPLLSPDQVNHTRDVCENLESDMRRFL